MSPGSSDPHHTYALYLMVVKRVDEAVAHLQRALALDPLSLPIRNSLAQALVHVDRFDEAVRECERMLELEPTFRPAFEGLGWCYVLMGDLDKAIEAFEEQARLTGGRGKGVTGLGFAYARAGRTQEAQELLEQVLEREGLEPDVVVTMDLLILHAGLGNAEEMFGYLNRAIDERLGTLVFLQGQRFWESLREDPRFIAAMERIGFPE